MEKTITKSEVRKTAVGAKVMYCGHNGWFAADIVTVAGALVVRASCAVTGDNIKRDSLSEATHHLSDFPVAGFWRPDLGVFVVPEDQVTVLEEGRRRQAEVDARLKKRK